GFEIIADESFMAEQTLHLPIAQSSNSVQLVRQVGQRGCVQRKCLQRTRGRFCDDAEELAVVLQRDCRRRTSLLRGPVRSALLEWRPQQARELVERVARRQP